MGCSSGSLVIIETSDSFIIAHLNYSSVMSTNDSFFLQRKEIGNFV